MRFSRVPKAVVVCLTVLLWIVGASAQQVRFFPDFSSVANLQLNGSAHQATVNSSKVLRLTNGYPGVGATRPETATSFFSLQQPVNSGFTTYFKFQISTAAICCTPGDGLAFVVQNSSATAIGTGFGGLGYAGISNSLAIELDTFKDAWDPNANHVAVQSCGTQPNSPVHTAGNCLVGSGISTNVPHLGVTCGTSTCANGVPHEVVIEYTIDEQHRQPYGIVHGGVHCGVIESACSTGAALDAMARGQSVVGVENHTSFIRAVRSGRVRVVATPITRGRRSQVWEATARNEAGQIVATGRVRLLCLDPGSDLAGKTVEPVPGGA